MPRLRRQNGNNVDTYQIFFQEPSELGLHHLPFRTKSGLYFPCVLGIGAWDLIPYRIWVVLLLHCSNVFQEVEREISFRTESRFPCVSGSGAWDLTPYRVWAVLLLHCSSVFQEMEREISFRTESGLYYSYSVPMCFRKWSARSHSVQNLGCITPTLFPCVSGSGVWDLILYQCSFWDLFGAKIRPHSQCKKVSLIPN